MPNPAYITASHFTYIAHISMYTVTYVPLIILLMWLAMDRGGSQRLTPVRAAYMTIAQCHGNGCLPLVT